MHALIERALEYAAKLNSVLGIIRDQTQDFSRLDLAQIDILIAVLNHNLQLAMGIRSKVIMYGKTKAQAKNGQKTI